MADLSRRGLLQLGAAGAGTLLLPGATASVLATGAAGGDADPHYFLLILLEGGADPSYLFDARPLAMTAAGRIQNYLGEEPGVWTGRNGQAARATRLVGPLAAFRDRFSVINGVYMTPGFDGHLQNMNFLFSGNPFGGDSFIPHLNGPDTGRTPGSLDAVLPTEPVFLNVHNHSSVVPLQPGSLRQLARKLRVAEPPREGDKVGQFIRNRLDVAAAGKGRFADGARLMRSGLDSAPALHHKLAALQAPDEGLSPEAQTIALVAECFRHGLSRSAIYVLKEQFDVHDAEQAKEQPALFEEAVGKVASLLRGLVETPFDAKRAMIDVTTVMVTSEFGRTMRAGGARIDQTGTNHNQYGNSILLGGKGIRPGLVIGATDLADEKAVASRAHLAMDRELEKVMGRPFDFATLKVRPDAPDVFRIEDHLTISSIVNTIYAMFDVPAPRYRAIGRNLPAAPVLHGLLT